MVLRSLATVSYTHLINQPVFSMGTDADPVEIAKEAVKYASVHGNDPVILDTAGRLHIDEQLMQELANIKTEVDTTEILLVVDSMTGQDLSLIHI